MGAFKAPGVERLLRNRDSALYLEGGRGRYGLMDRDLISACHVDNKICQDRALALIIGTFVSFFFFKKILLPNKRTLLVRDEFREGEMIVTNNSYEKLRRISWH